MVPDYVLLSAHSPAPFNPLVLMAPRFNVDRNPFCRRIGSRTVALPREIMRDLCHPH